MTHIMCASYDQISAAFDEDSSFAEQAAAYQLLIDDGSAWRLEGHVGRTAMDLIEQGYCTLGEVGHRNFYGNYVPSRFEVEPGTKGSASYQEAQAALRDEG